MNKLKQLKDSFYVKKIKENKNFIILSFGLAVLFTLISYPGIFYSDSYTRYYLANTIGECIQKLLTGQRALIEASSWLTVVPSFFMEICKSLTGNIATYTVIQAFLFFLATFLFSKKLSNKYKKLQYVFWALNPLIFCVSVYYEASVLCVAAMVYVILILDHVKEEKSRFDNILEFFLLTFFSFIIFGYRANAFTIIPVLLFYIFKLNITKIKKFIITASLGLGFVLVPGFTWLLNIDTMSSFCAGFAWEIVSVIQEMDEDKQASYIDYLDEIGGEGSTAKALELSTHNSINPFFTGISAQSLSIKGNSSKVLNKYINIIFTNPLEYFKIKGEFTLRTLGIWQVLDYKEYNYNRYDRMKNFNFSDSRARKLFVDTYEATNSIFSFFTRCPWVVYTITFILIMIKRKKKDSKFQFYLLVFALSIFYYGAYIINTQAFEIRYFYPSLYLCFIMDVAILGDICYFYIEKFKSRKLQGKNTTPKKLTHA